MSDGGVPPRAWAPAAVVVAYGVALAFLHYHFPRFPSPNERARLYVLEALVEHGTLAIDQPVRAHGDIDDKIVFQGRTYANKAPGLAALALPGYLLARLVAALAGTPLPLSWALYLSRLLAVSLPAVVWLALFSRRLERSLAPAPRAVLLAGVAFGTGMLPHGATLMANAAVAGLVGIAALLLTEETAGGPRRFAAIGLLLGFAVACEYPVFPLVTVLALWALARSGSARSAAALLAGMLPAALLILAYNAACYQGPLDFGYGHYRADQFGDIHQTGFFGFGWPRAAWLYGLLLGPSKGLLVWSPVVLLALLGGVRLWRDGQRRPVAALAAASLALLLFLGGYPNWHSGWSVGPRYLLPMVPLLALLAAGALRDAPRAHILAGGLAAAGVALNAAAALTWPYLPDNLDNPLADLVWPLVRAGEWAPSAGGRAGLLLAAAACLLALLAALAVRPLPALALAAALTALTAARAPARPSATFFHAEVLYLRGSLPAARARFIDLLRHQRPGPAMEQHARTRVAQIDAEQVDRR